MTSMSPAHIAGECAGFQVETGDHEAVTSSAQVQELQTLLSPAGHHDTRLLKSFVLLRRDAGSENNLSPKAKKGQMEVVKKPGFICTLIRLNSMSDRQALILQELQHGDCPDARTWLQN